MNNELIEQLAREAGFRPMELLPPSVGDPLGGNVSRVHLFAALVAETLARAIDGAAFSPSATASEVQKMCAQAVRLAFPMPKEPT